MVSRPPVVGGGASGDAGGVAQPGTGPVGSTLPSLVAGPFISKAKINTTGITFIIDGGGAVITTGEKGYVEIAFRMSIRGWTVVADQSGSIVVDIWKDSYANFPPTVADTITGTEKPTLAAAQRNQDLTLTTWTTTLAVGDILAFNVDSVATVTRVAVCLRGVRA